MVSIKNNLLKTSFFMKSVTIKLNRIVNFPSFENFPNKQELFQAFEDLNKIFNSPISPRLFQKVIKELKDNSFYRQFKLYADPIFFTALAKKIDNFEIIEMART